MTAPRPFLTAAVAALALATVLASASDTSARPRLGGHATGQHLGHHQHRFHLQQIRQYRHRQHRHFFTRFKPCLVWTRQGWTDVCTVTR